MRILRVMVAGLCVACRSASTAAIPAASSSGPIIDAHLHTFDMTWTSGMDTSWWPPTIPHPTTDTGLVNETVAALRANGIVRAVASGTRMSTIGRYASAAPQTIVPALMFGASADIDSLRAQYRRGALRAFGEVIWQYAGLSPADSSVEKYWALAEELDAPIGIHMGLGPPEQQLHGRYRSVLSDPLALETVLVKHPHLRVWVMHAGWPLSDRMVALLYAFPRVYVDVSVINWYIPRAEFHGYLKRLVDAGFGDRIMYGSDQMIWPASLPIGIDAINRAPFLTASQKRNIFCNNAARFFRFEQGICAR